MPSDHDRNTLIRWNIIIYALSAALGQSNIPNSHQDAKIQHVGSAIGSVVSFFKAQSMPQKVLSVADVALHWANVIFHEEQRQQLEP